MTFYAWLSRQTARQDAVGALARFAVKDRVFPREVRKLVILMKRFEGRPEFQASVKIAHAEWRRWSGRQ